MAEPSQAGIENESEKRGHFSRFLFKKEGKFKLFQIATLTFNIVIFIVYLLAVIRQGRVVLSRRTDSNVFNFSSMNNLALVIRAQVSSDPSLVGKSTLGFISRRFQVLICIKVLGLKIRIFQRLLRKRYLLLFRKCSPSVSTLTGL